MLEVELKMIGLETLVCIIVYLSNHFVCVQDHMRTNMFVSWSQD